MTGVQCRDEDTYRNEISCSTESTFPTRYLKRADIDTARQPAAGWRNFMIQGRCDVPNFIEPVKRRRIFYIVMSLLPQNSTAILRQVW
jgi:hypothetical protein